MILIMKIRIYKLIYKDHLLQNNPINMQNQVNNQKKIRIYLKLKIFYLKLKMFYLKLKIFKSIMIMDRIQKNKFKKLK